MDQCSQRQTISRDQSGDPKRHGDSRRALPFGRSLRVFIEHGAQVDLESQIVRLSPDLVLEAMSQAPRTYTLAGRAEGTELILDGPASFYSTDD